MSNDKIECNFEQMEGLAGRFMARSDTMQQRVNAIWNMAETLHSDGWIGEGSDAFFAEMSDEIKPRLTKLTQALEEAANTVRQISQTVAEAEDQAGQLFR